MKEFFHMGGYALYVWVSYALMAGVLIVNLVVPVLRRRTLLRELGQHYLREQRAEMKAAASKQQIHVDSGK